MTMAKNPDTFTPTTDELDALVEDVIETAHNGTWPLYMIDNFGHPYYGYYHDGTDFDVCPWLLATDRFVATDARQRIHWMHPMMKARIAILDFEDFYPEVSHSNRIEHLSRKETAQALDEHALEALIKLERRQRTTEPLYQALLRIQPEGDARQAQNRLLDLFSQFSITPDIGWSLAQICLKIERTTNTHVDVHVCPITRASILARLIDPYATRKPNLTKVRQSLITLNISTGSEPTHVDREEDVAIVAEALTHGIISRNFCLNEDIAITQIDLTIARIERGDYDPKAEAPFPEEKMEIAIIQVLKQDTRSSHDIFRLVTAAERRLKEVGSKARIDIKRCLDQQSDDEIPF